MKKFEYHVLVAKAFYGIPLKEMNELGKQGWELVLSLGNERDYAICFKRELKSVKNEKH